MEEMVKLVGSFGFPVKGKLNELSTSITELAKAVAVLKAYEEGGTRWIGKRS